MEGAARSYARIMPGSCMGYSGSLLSRRGLSSFGQSIAWWMYVSWMSLNS